MIPLFQYVQVYLFDPHRVSGISSHPRQQQDMFLIDIIGDGKGSEQPRAIPAQTRPEESSKETKQQSSNAGTASDDDRMFSICCFADPLICRSPQGGRPCSA